MSFSCGSGAANLVQAPLYEKFFQEFVDEMYLHDEQGILLDVNAAACLNLGYRRDELVGMSVTQISASFAPHELLALWRDHPVGHSIAASNSHRRKDGSIYHMDVHITCQEIHHKKYFLAAVRGSEEKRQREHEIIQLNERLHALVDERTRQWQESSRLLNAVMEQTPDLVFIKDLDGRYQYANQAFADHLGLSIGDVLGRTDTELYAPEQAQAFLASDAEVLHAQASRVYESRIQNVGQAVYANTMKTPYRDEQGTVVGILGISRNVSEIRNTQELMKHNYEMLRQAERVAKIGSWTLNLSTNAFQASEMLMEMNGLSPEDPPLTPETLSSMIPPEQHAVLSHAIAQCIHSGTPYTVDVEHKRPEGGRFPARIRGQAYRDDNGKVVMLHGTVQDLSEHVEADERLQTLADNLPNGAIYRCEQLEGHRLVARYVSAGIQRLLGIAASTFLNEQKTFANQIHADDKAAFFSAVWHSLQNQTPFDLAFRMHNAQQEIRWVHARAVHRRSHQGLLWEGILLDVTTDYENQESLRLAKEAAEAAERAKSDFLATMSHEIRTPMNTVIGMTQLLQQTPMSSKQRSYLDKVGMSATALLKIINEILDFSKLEVQKLALAPTAFELEALLAAVVNETGFHAEQKGIEIVYDIDSSVPRQLWGDVQRLAQILTNLVSNAIKFTDRGEVLIRMHAQPQRQTPQTHMLYVAVQDTGIGIHPEHMGLLFQPFAQAEAHISRRFGGTGLGLSICHRLVQLMGGDISVQSTLGQGSRFEFFVPLQAQTSAAPPKNFHDQDCRVLVVDDNLLARETLAAMVQNFGLSCDVTDSGEHALALLEQANHSFTPYQLVLMDWQMPGMDGLQAAQRIRDNAQLATTPAMLMVTAYNRDEVIDQVAALGLQGLLIKPVTESALFDAIQEALHPHHRADDLHIKHLPHTPTMHIPVQLQGRRVLVVDDNALNREVAQGLLELAGVQVTTASSGLEALELLQRSGFDAVLLDVQMPHMDGMEVARRIRQQPQWSCLPVWALTAQATEEDRQAILASGMDGQLTKPIHAPLLYEALQQAFAHLEPRRCSDAPPRMHDHSLDCGIAKYFSGQQERMQRLLRAFVRDFSGAAEQMLALYQAKNLTELGMLAHTLKGSIGYLDHPAAMQAMESLEWACKQGHASSALVASAAEYLQQVLRQVQQHMATDPQAPHDSPPSALLDHAALIAYIDQALPAIQRGEYAGIRALEQVEMMLRGNVLHGLAAQALALTEDLETQAACTSLLELRSALLQL